jgi:hypothetical protein
LKSFDGSDGLPAFGVDDGEVFKDFVRIGSALMQYFFQLREMVSNKIQIQHSELT